MDEDVSQNRLEEGKGCGGFGCFRLLRPSRVGSGGCCGGEPGKQSGADLERSRQRERAYRKSRAESFRNGDGRWKHGEGNVAGGRHMQTVVKREAGHQARESGNVRSGRW